ncbi:hypothetical protein JCM11641_005113 [Rhodosporidiobolus odoratus]
MPARSRDEVGLNGSTSSAKRGFLSRALSSKATGSKKPPDGRGISSDALALGLPGDLTRRLSLAPSVANEPAASSPSSPGRPPTSRSASAYSPRPSASSTSPSVSTSNRRFSLYDPTNPIFPSPPRSREASAASSQNGHAHSLHSAASTSSLHPLVVEDNHFMTSPVSSPRSPSPSPLFSFSPAPPSLARAPPSSYGTPVPSTSASPPGEAARDPLASVFSFAPPSPGAFRTSQMDEMVDGMRRARSRSRASSRKGKERAREGEFKPEGRRDEEEQEARNRRRRDHTRESSTMSSDRGGAGGGVSDNPRSRESSAALSDASFASMTALPPSSHANIPDPIDEYDLTGVPSLLRQERLRTLQRPWMAGPAAGGAKSIEEIVGLYRGQLRGDAAGAGRFGNGISLLPPSPPLPYASFPSPPSSSTSPPPSFHFSTPPPFVASSSLPPTPTRIKTIEEIIAEHAGPSLLSPTRTPSSSAPPSTTAPLSPSSEAKLLRGGTETSQQQRDRENSVQSLSSVGTESSLDSLNRELRSSARAQSHNGSYQPNGTGEVDEATTPRTLQHARSFSSRPPPSPSAASSNGAFIPAADALLHDDDNRSLHSFVSSAGPSTPRVSSPKPLYEPDSLAAETQLAHLLKSPRLTRLVTLKSGLTVSLADVGAADGHPVLVFLGLGSVRYLIALYDEIAATFNLRLICFDRWGLGRTSDVPDSQRGFVEWSEIVEELVSPSLLDLTSFSVLAHSAGAPYAAASAVRPHLLDKIHGSLHLLAPWVSTSADSLAGMYKYLKYVPSGVLKTAQAAEWKMQAWRLGKPPQIVHAAVGYDAKVGRMVGEGEAAGESEEMGDRAGAGARSGSWSPSLEMGSPVTKAGRTFSSASSVAGAGAAKVAELYGADAGVLVAGPANAAGTRKASVGGWKLLGGGRRTERSTTVPGCEDGGSPLRPTSMLLKRSSSYTSSPGTTPPPSTSTCETAAASSRALSPNDLPTPVSKRSSVFSTASTGSPSPAPRTRTISHSSISSVLNRNARPPTPVNTGVAFSGPSPLLSPSSPLASSTASLPRCISPSPAPASASSIAPAALIDGLLRASHAESLRGGTSDLLVLLERTSSSSNSTSGTNSKKSQGPGLGFEYRDLQSSLKVWYGDRDDRISLGSIRWLEKEVKERGKKGVCEVKVVEGADHGLMANGRVMFEVLESIASEWNNPPDPSSPNPATTSSRHR